MPNIQICLNEVQMLEQSHQRTTCIKPVFAPPPPLGSQKTKVTVQHNLWIDLLDE